MKIEITYKFELNGTLIVLTENQARELYNELAKSFLEKSTPNSIFSPKTILKPSDYPYSTPVYCNSKPDQNIGC